MTIEKEAKYIAEKYVEEKLSNPEYNFKVQEIIEFKEGFLVFYQSKRFVENKSIKDAIVGLNPFIIDKKDSSIYHDECSYLDDPELIEQFKKEKGYY